MPKFNEWLFGSAPKIEKLPTGNPQQENFFSNFINQLMQSQNGQSGGYGQSQDYLSGLFGENAFQNFSEPFNQQFQQQFQQDLMPRIAERFAGFGNSSGALSSTGFGQALGGAAAQGSSNLQSQLAQLFSQLQMQGSNQLGQQNQQQSQMALNHQPFAYNQNQGMTGAFLPMLQALAKGSAGMG